MAPAMAGPLGQVCPTGYNFPCAVINTLQLSSHSLVRVTACLSVAPLVLL
jgi:hypothetical protein